MPVSLVKGQRVDLTKSNPGLSNVFVGLGWDVKKQKSGIRTFFGNDSHGSSNFDLDASAILIGDNDKLNSGSDVVYFGNLKNQNSSVAHTGDNLTGEGSGDDERIYVDLKKVPNNINKVVVAVTIYQAENRKQNFGQVENSFVRVVDPTTNKELLRYNLKDTYSQDTQVVMGELYKHNGEWKFAAIGRGFKGGLKELTEYYKTEPNLRDRRPQTMERAYGM